MLKKSLLTLLLITTTYAQAETCPSLDAVKSGHFQHWRVLDIDDGSPASGALVKKFQQTVTKFTMAEWMVDAPEGSGHCYYSSDTSIFLAKFKLRAKSDPIWQTVADTMQCTVGIEQCQFQDTV